MSNNRKKKTFDREYILRFGLLCMIALGLILLSWSYKFKSNVIVSLNESNIDMFNDKFLELAEASQHGTYRELDLSMMGQKKINLTVVERNNYRMNMDAFLNLPEVPGDWGNSKYAFDTGRYYILRSVSKEYYLQPEFHDDWKLLGRGYFENANSACKGGIFGSPSVQKIYTKPGATIETYAIFRSSFCSGTRQAFKPVLKFPKDGTTEDGIYYSQDPDTVSRYISASFDPDGYILGKSFPVFDGDWAQKSKIQIDVADGTPKGLYVVSVGADYYKPLMFFGSNVNFDAYDSKKGTPLINFIIAVD